jgi:hypothetical protein
VTRRRPENRCIQRVFSVESRRSAPGQNLSASILQCHCTFYSQIWACLMAEAHISDPPERWADRSPRPIESLEAFGLYSRRFAAQLKSTWGRTKGIPSIQIGYCAGDCRLVDAFSCRTCSCPPSDDANPSGGGDHAMSCHKLDSLQQAVGTRHVVSLQEKPGGTTKPRPIPWYLCRDTGCPPLSFKRRRAGVPCPVAFVISYTLRCSRASRQTRDFV